MKDNEGCMYNFEIRALLEHFHFVLLHTSILHLLRQLYLVYHADLVVTCKICDEHLKEGALNY